MIEVKDFKELQFFAEFFSDHLDDLDVTEYCPECVKDIFMFRRYFDQFLSDMSTKYDLGS